MIIVDKKEFRTGALLGVSFLVVLTIMFMPRFRWEECVRGV